MKDSDTIINRKEWEEIKTAIIICQIILPILVGLFGTRCVYDSGQEEGQRKMCEEICETQLISVKENRCYCASMEIK